MATESITAGDIVLAPFHFVETNEAKLRPCLVWSVTPVSASLVFISSKKLVRGFEQEVVLGAEDALSIGLLKPSRIDFGKHDRCLLADVVKVIGKLAALQRSELRKCFAAASAAGLLR